MISTEEIHVINLVIMQLSPAWCYLISLRSKYPLQNSAPQTPSMCCVLSLTWEPTLRIRKSNRYNYSFYIPLFTAGELGSCSRYSDWLRAARSRGQSSSLGRGKNFLFSMSSRPVLGPIQPPIQWVNGALSSGVKRPEREADHSPPTSEEIKKTWIYKATSHTPSWRSA
jgi:hypothetical protein